MSALYVHADIRSLIKAMEQRLKQEAEQIDLVLFYAKLAAKNLEEAST